MDSISRKNKRRSGFKSYIKEDYQERAVDVPEEPVTDKVEPFLFRGEAPVAEAHNVHKISPLKNSTVGILGTLFITNFKVSFVTASLPVDAKENELVCGCLHSDFIGLHDISLTEIDSIYFLSEGSKKKKLVGPSTVPNKIQDLLIVLKNFRNVVFNFRLTPPKQDIKIANALIKHRNPMRIDLLYLALDTPPPKTGIPEFRFAQEWERELNRTRCPNWRVCKHNENHKPFASLSSTFVVPHGITDKVLENAAHHFKGNRPPVWCWGTPRGAALVRMAQLSPNITSNSSVENDLIKKVHQCHSQKVPPTIIDLDRDLPSLKVIQASYIKLRDLHTPDSLAAFNDSEKYYLSRWQSSGWLTHIRQCLEVAQKAAAAIRIKNSSVILQESEARDLSCVISSIIQILLDPYARTLRGFHTLIQKEWIALGHPFSIRLGHLRQNNDELCPVWFVFLDCVRQICVHHPTALEFTEDYLIALLHGSHCSLHSSFMFDSHRDESSTFKTLQDLEESCSNIYFWPVWTWWSRSEGPRSKALRLIHESETANSSLDTTNIPNDGLIESFQRLRTSSKVGRNILMEKYGIDLLSEKEIRKNMREKFINVLYVQALLKPLLSLREFSRLADPVASAHFKLQQLIHLVGNAESPLPYDPSQPPPVLDPEMKQALPSIRQWWVKPWTECFGMWLTEPVSQMSQGERQRPVIEPCISNYREHWKCVYEIVLMLQNHIGLKGVTQNGASS